ncbi:hypothetical protein QBC40DRAFT_51811 [Triangularia verruculosa]|uniref:Uncharacterized protein n=1 Tax=Triangularia verruculosa TaxID=2587418 RepID=A0AAN6XJA8_9PEZI|nr:hypothetical protein QBC40DRAFT_51811 [Triangularia verruculosa]
MASVFALLLLLLFFSSGQAHLQHRRWGPPSGVYTKTRLPFTIMAVATPTTTPATRVSVIPIDDEPTTTTSRERVSVIPIPDTIWTTVPIANLTDPFCINVAAPHEGIGNHCVCENGETLSIIPYTTGVNMSDYQPCAYTTVDPETTESTAQ